MIERMLLLFSYRKGKIGKVNIKTTGTFHIPGKLFGRILIKRKRVMTIGHIWKG